MKKKTRNLIRLRVLSFWGYEQKGGSAINISN